MSSLFDRLKQSRGTNATQLQNRLEQQGQRVNRQDPRMWKYTWNSKGTSENIIRFLPVPLVDMQAQENGDIPKDAVLTPVAFVLRHSFQGPGGWYIENSPQTFGEEDPVRDHDRPLWQKQKATNDNALKEVLKERLPSTEYIANILVIKDGTNPENNGKVMLFKFGNAVKKILDKTQEKKFDTDVVFDPYDFWEGRNLMLNLESEERTFGGRTVKVPKWDNVKWADASLFLDGDEAKVEELWAKQHSLFEFYDRKNYKTYAELEEQLRRALKIPADMPLVESGVASMAQSPASTAQAGNQQQAQGTGQAQQATAQPAQQTHAQQAQSSAPANQMDDAGGIEDFEKFLQAE